MITTADGKPLPHSVVEQLAQHGELIGQIFSTTGELLWQGRSVRLATPAQIFGLIARDGGCVRCGKHHDHCIAHHTLPFEAPAQGETNIDQLAFLCDDCHHRLHANNQTLYRDPQTQTWRIRAATWDEIPPDKRAPPAKPPGKYTDSSKRRPRGSPESQTSDPKPRLDEQRTNQKRHDPHGDRLF